MTAVDLRHGAAAEAIRRHRLIVILRRVGSVDHLVALIEELADAGARIFEVTFDDPAAAKALKASAERLAGRSDGSFLVGAGTIRTEDQLRAATYAGAAFVSRQLSIASWSTQPSLRPVHPWRGNPNRGRGGMAKRGDLCETVPGILTRTVVRPRITRPDAGGRDDSHGGNQRSERPAIPGRRGGRDRYRIRAIEGKPGSTAQPGRSRGS